MRAKPNLRQCNAPSTKRLHEVFTYKHETGDLVWKVKVSDKVVVGATAGTTTAIGYRQIRLDNKLYLAHRLIWQLITGKQPSGVIDHIDGCRNNNVFENLRDVTASINSQNMLIKGKKYLPGVASNGARFMARIGIDKVTNYLGTYDTEEQAHAVYIKYKTRLSPRMLKKQQESP